MDMVWGGGSSSVGFSLRHKVLRHRVRESRKQNNSFFVVCGFAREVQENASARVASIGDCAAALRRRRRHFHVPPNGGPTLLKSERRYWSFLKMP
jgi:hypothetical protein